MVVKTFTTPESLPPLVLASLFRWKNSLQESDILTVYDCFNVSDFTRARTILSRLILSDPSNPHLRILDAIAILSAKPIERLGNSAITAAESSLKFVLQDEQFGPTALVILGILKYDYYFVNGRPEGQPSIAKIKQEYIKWSSIKPELRPFIPGTQDAKRQFGLS